MYTFFSLRRHRSDCIEQLHKKMTTDALPDEVLLHSFYFYVDQNPNGDSWHTLVHVCQRWRFVVFASPKYLNLRLLCNHDRLAKQLLDVWPSSFPVVITDRSLSVTRGQLKDARKLEGAKIIIAALKHRDRISTIDLRYVPTMLWKPFLAITEPFPLLTSLRLDLWDEDIQVLTDSFLGGSCPRLQELYLDGIPFPGLGNLLSSTSDLINLHLEDIPHSSYIPPEAMISYLSASSTKLESLHLELRSPQPQAKRASQHPPTMTRVVLAALTRFRFRGDSKYLEEILSHIDTPLLESITITFFDCLILDTPQLRRFISHTEIFTAFHRADIIFDGDYSDVSVTFSPSDVLGSTDRGVLTLGVRCTESGPGFVSLVRLCNSALPSFPTLERLSIQYYHSPGNPGVSVTEWVEFLRVFPFVKDLYISSNGRLNYSILPAMTALAGEIVVKTLPALQNLFVHRSWGSQHFMKSFDSFVAARQLSGRPIALHFLE